MHTYMVQQCFGVVVLCWIRGLNGSASYLDPLLFMQCLKECLLEVVYPVQGMTVCS